MSGRILSALAVVVLSLNSIETLEEKVFLGCPFLKISVLNNDKEMQVINP